MYFRAAVVLIAILVLAACASTGTLTTAFDPSAAAFINAKGKATVTGQAFQRRNDGLVVYGAGSDVTLIPKTAYSDDIITQMFGGAHFAYAPKTFKNQDPSFSQYVRHTVADGEGKFAFTGVADGSYYIVTYVTWTVDSIQQGGGVMMPVTVNASQSVNVIMSGD